MVEHLIRVTGLSTKKSPLLFISFNKNKKRFTKTKTGHLSFIKRYHALPHHLCHHKLPPKVPGSLLPTRKNKADYLSASVILHYFGFLFVSLTQKAIFTPDSKIFLKSNIFIWNNFRIRIILIIFAPEIKSYKPNTSTKTKRHEKYQRNSDRTESVKVVRR